MSTESFWQSYARDYDTVWDSPVTWQVRGVITTALSHSRRIVDLGCGTGLMTKTLVENGAHVIGVDSSADMLAIALRTGRVSRAIQAPAELVPLGPHSADAVIIANVLHLHPNPEAVITQAHRLVTPTGLIVATWPVPGLTPAAMYRADRRAGRPISSALRARVLRHRIGVLASRTPGTIATRARGLNDTHEILGLLGPRSALELTTVHECQHVAVVRHSDEAG